MRIKVSFFLKSYSESYLSNSSGSLREAHRGWDLINALGF